MKTLFTQAGTIGSLGLEYRVPNGKTFELACLTLHNTTAPDIDITVQASVSSSGRATIIAATLAQKETEILVKPLALNTSDRLLVTGANIDYYLAGWLQDIGN